MFTLSQWNWIKRNLFFDRSAFGELTIEEPTPILQASAQYDTLGNRTRALFNGTGSAGGATGGEFYCTSGTTANGFASTFSRQSINYHAGQGIEGRLTCRFDTPVASSAQYGGMLNATDALAFGYSGTDFGIFYRHNGQQEIQELQVTGAAGGAENATVTIDGTGYTVPLTAGTVQHNATEIAASLESQLPLWNFQQVDDTVVCRSLIADLFPGVFSFSSATATATFTQIAAGADVTEDFIAQTDWNMDKAAWLDPSKGNVYQIQAQYLGYGNFFFAIENPETGHFTQVHEVKNANSVTSPTLANPTFRMGWVAQSRGTTTSLTTSGASYAAFTEGKHEILEPSRSVDNDLTGVSAEVPVVSVQMREVFGDKVSIAVAAPLLLSANTDSTRGAVVRLYRNGTLTGANWQYVDVDESTMLVDSASTAYTPGTDVLNIDVGSGAGIILDLTPYKIDLAPGDTLTVTMEKLGGGTMECSASLVWQEDI